MFSHFRSNRLDVGWVPQRGRERKREWCAVKQSESSEWNWSKFDSVNFARNRLTNIFFCRFRYNAIHGYLSLPVCVFGSIANILNIVVLTRREMRSPTNFILTGLAIADLLVMIDYIPFVCLDNILPHLHYSRETLLAYSSAWYILFHSIFAQICHTISIWLTVTLAVWRYIAVGFPQKNRLWCGIKTTLIAIASSYIVCPLVAIPLYLTYSIRPTVEYLDEYGQLVKNPTNLTTINTTGHNVTVYKVSHSDLARANQTLLNLNFWIYSILIKLIPCIALTILSLRLIGALLEAKRRRKQLTSHSNGMKQLVNGKAVLTNRKNNKQLEKEKQTDRTTRMLLAVLLLFLTTEFPQAVLGLLCVVLGQAFFMECYLKLGKWPILNSNDFNLVKMMKQLNSTLRAIQFGGKKEISPSSNKFKYQGVNIRHHFASSHLSRPSPQQ